MDRAQKGKLGRGLLMAPLLALLRDHLLTFRKMGIRAKILAGDTTDDEVDPEFLIQAEDVEKELEASSVGNCGIGYPFLRKLNLVLLTMIVLCTPEAFVAQQSTLTKCQQGKYAFKLFAFDEAHTGKGQNKWRESMKQLAGASVWWRTTRWIFMTATPSDPAVEWLKAEFKMPNLVVLNRRVWILPSFKFLMEKEEKKRRGKKKKKKNKNLKLSTNS